MASGALDKLLESLGKLSEKLRVLQAVRSAGLLTHTAKVWGPALILGRLWEEQGMAELIVPSSGKNFLGDPGLNWGVREIQFWPANEDRSRRCT